MSHSILVVDDDSDVREAVALSLEDAGHQVATAAHGGEALALLDDGLCPHLILLDLMMPVMDGFEFCARWSADEKLRAIPVVILSADAATQEKARRCGATGFLKKPVKLGQLLDAVNRYVPQ